ncbi:hypothetical protein POSPLADRAFT_1061858 [Postia placenta MAD-698-R-SB12]|uniref:Uncharacterized protein n=1 Tax=Postia placenta MAD-698-R-SB12 TaxID=670580 RepID=A0A1X6ML73_9APHY|nr:hypothetical protein POSPLADRAFT_1061858 [Postia placenta MAD-698-R-SB12]OSX57157.1 hypothetical protein POSPLADRAFT_1061858 [Postia placenta MAD-698-R-SB12]
MPFSLFRRQATHCDFYATATPSHATLMSPSHAAATPSHVALAPSHATAAPAHPVLAPAHVALTPSTAAHVQDGFPDAHRAPCTRLTIAGTMFTEDIVDGLARPLPDGRWTCPAVTDIAVSGYCSGFSDCPSTQAAFVDMLRARHAAAFAPRGQHPDCAVAPLSRVRVNAEGLVGISAGARAWLDANMAYVEWGEWVGGTECMRGSAP